MTLEILATPEILVIPEILAILEILAGQEIPEDFQRSSPVPQPASRSRCWSRQGERSGS